MFGFLRYLSQGAGTAIAFITGGILTMIWTGVWYYWLRQQDAPAGDSRYYFCCGFFLSGLAIMVVGLLIGRIGAEAKSADTGGTVMAPSAVAPVVAQPAEATGTPVATTPAAPNGVVTTVGTM